MKTSEQIVAILMCTYNGEKFLAEQLDSFLDQTHKNIVLWISDDGSTDGTLDILKEYQGKFPKDSLNIVKGPGKGSVINFLSILCNPDLKADYYAFADQDDIWEKEKISTALSKVSKFPEDIAVLYGSRTKTVDENGVELGYSTIFPKAPCFKNALVQSIAGGNTMLMNNNAADIMRKAGPMQVISHDWWAYMLISGAGGRVIYDDYPSLLYRQHGNNQIGANTSWAARAKRLGLLLSGSFREWNNINVNALLKVKYLLNKENQAILDKFENSRNGALLSRVVGLWKLGIFRQTFLGNLALAFAIILKKI